MSLNSFRLKIALLSGLITGLLLIGSEVVLWRVSYQFNLDRLDHEIRNLGQANLDRVLGGDHWVRLEEALKFVSGEQPSAKYVLWVKNYDRVVFQSPDWPTSISPESFPVPARYETAGRSEAGTTVAATASSRRTNFTAKPGAATQSGAILHAGIRR